MNYLIQYLIGGSNNTLNINQKQKKLNEINKQQELIEKKNKKF